MTTDWIVKHIDDIDNMMTSFLSWLLWFWSIILNIETIVSRVPILTVTHVNTTHPKRELLGMFVKFELYHSTPTNAQVNTSVEKCHNFTSGSLIANGD